MATPILRRSFLAFHLTLGLTLLYLSARTALEALAPGAGPVSPHVVVVSTLEAVGATLFLLPRTLRVGGALLLVSIGAAVVLHALAGQFRGDLLVYAAGTWFVMVHGSASARLTPASQLR
jgi:hypothetical protein